MPGHARLEQLHQIRVHEGVLVRNIEAYDPLSAQRTAEFALQLGAVLLLHHHDQVGPGDQFAAQRIFGVQAGQVLKVRNSDPMLHNVHSVSRAGNKQRNVAQPVKGMTTDFIFEKPEVFVQFKCDVHPWMFAYVGVVEHPWFAVTDGNGAFALPAGLPPGRYTLAAVHRKLGEQTQTVTVGAGGSGPVEFTLEVPALLS